MLAKVFIIILNWNDLADIIERSESLMKVNEGDRL